MKKTNKPYQEYFLVATGNQALRNSGNLLTTGSSVNLTAGQFGVVNAATNAFLSGAGTETVANIPAIRIVQGTSRSANFSANKGWTGLEIPPFVSTPNLEAYTIQQVATKLPAVESYSAVLYTGLSAPVVGNRYALNVQMRSVRKDKTHGPNLDAYVAGFTAPESFTGLTSPTSHIVGNLIFNANMVSKLNTLLPIYKQQGNNKQFIVLGLNLSGAATGTAIGALAVGNSVNVMTDGTNTLALTLNKAWIQTLHNLIDNSTAVDASTKIVNVNPSTAHSQGIDAFVVVGLDHETAAAYDEIAQTKVSVEPTTFAWTEGTYTENVASAPVEKEGSGRFLKIWFNERAYGQTGNTQLAGFSDSLITAPEFIDEAADYTVTVIDLLTGDSNNDDDTHQQVRVWILLPATDNSGSTTAADGITASTSASTTVTALNTILGAWLLRSAPFELNGSATSSALFV